MSFRERIRTSVPGSTQFYEEAVNRWKSRGTRAQVQSLVQSGDPIHLDIGAGDVPRPQWVTLDITNSCDLYWDLRRGIPFPSNSVRTVYSSHLLEHMDYRSGQALLSEVFRVLEPGGQVSVCVPNARLYIDAYLGTRDLDPNHDFWEPALHERTGISLVNYVAYMGGEHHCLFDSESLLKRLTDVGFTNVTSRSFDPDIDLPEREIESIYARARKPENASL